MEKKKADEWTPKSNPVPSHWKQAGFADCFGTIPTTGMKTPQKEYETSGKYPIVDQGADFIGGYTDDESKVIRVSEPVLVFGDHTKCLKFLQQDFAPGADGIHVLTVLGHEPKFLYYQYFSLRFPDRGYSRHFSFLKRSKFSIAPLNEQRRIVEKIENLFAELDKGEESLQAAKARAGLYRQSLLKHAFEGHLTADWRAANPDKLEDPETLLTRIQNEREARYKQALDDWQEALEKWRDEGEDGKRPQKPRRAKDLDKIPEEELKKLSGLPQSWCWVELGHLTWSVKDGPHYSPKYSESGIPFISGGNIRPEGIDFDSAKYISKELHEELSQRCKPELGDVLYTKGGTTGISRVNTYDFEFNVWVHVAVLKITASTLPFYLQQALNSPFCYQQSQSFTHGVGNQDLGLTRMVNIRLPLCSVDEQAELVKRLEAKLSTLNHLENQLEEQLARSKTLRQSILKRAFAGELVDQDPNDEPASTLLERIKAEKAEAEIAAERDRKTKPVRKHKNRRPTMTDLIEVLKKEGDWVSASKAAQGLGIADGTSSDDVEAFYRQLKERIEANEIEVERRGDEDWLRLAKIEAN